MGHSFVTLCIFFAIVALSAVLFILIPKGFFPQQDNGFLNAVSDMPQNISFTEMKWRQEELNAIMQADPVDSIAMFIGGGSTALNSERMYITLNRSATPNAQQIIAPLRPKLAEVNGAHLYMQASQDVRLGGRATRTQFEFTLQVDRLLGARSCRRGLSLLSQGIVPIARRRYGGRITSSGESFREPSRSAHRQRGRRK